MSNEIYYERGFIRVDERFIPIVNQGSSNCWQSNLRGRDIPEKGWHVMNYRNRSNLLFTEEEIREIAIDYERISMESKSCFKSRYRPFEAGEFERWILCGLKSAYTIEEYVSFGNDLYILDYSNYKNLKKYPFSTTEDFLKHLDELKGCEELNVSFSYNRGLNKPKQARKKSVKKSLHGMSEYYVLSALYGENNSKIYFASLTRNGFKYVSSPENHSSKAFQTENEANKYLDKYRTRLELHMAFSAERIENNICGINKKTSA